MLKTADRLADLRAPHLREPDKERVLEVLRERRALLTGHFGLNTGEHTDTALRFRAIGNDHDSLTDIARLASSVARLDWQGKVLLCPDSAGFFLARGIEKLHALETCVVQTDLRRLPTATIIKGHIKPGDNVVIVNDVVRTGSSIDPMRQLVSQQGATLVGVVVFAQLDAPRFEQYCSALGIVGCSLVNGVWPTFVPNETCDRCKLGEPLIPIAEFA